MFVQPGTDRDDRTQAGFGRRVGCDMSHGRRHVDADGVAAPPDAASRQQQVHAGAAGVVEDGLARMDWPDAQRIADAGETRRARVGQ